MTQFLWSPESKQRRDYLTENGYCINGLSHGKATSGRLCAWCRAVHNRGVQAVLADRPLLRALLDTGVHAVSEPEEFERALTPVLDAAEVEALRFARGYLSAGISPLSKGDLKRAIAVLDKLISRGDK